MVYERHPLQYYCTSHSQVLSAGISRCPHSIMSPLTLGVMLFVIPTLLGHKEIFTLPLPEPILGYFPSYALVQRHATLSPEPLDQRSHLSLFKRDIYRFL